MYTCVLIRLVLIFFACGGQVVRKCLSFSGGPQKFSGFCRWSANFRPTPPPPPPLPFFVKGLKHLKNEKFYGPDPYGSPAFLVTLGTVHILRHQGFGDPGPPPRVIKFYL